MLLPTWLNTEFLQAIGWTLIHSIWQSLILLLAMKLLLLFMSKRSAQLRYAASISFLFAMLLCTALTFRHQYSEAGNIQASAPHLTGKQANTIITNQAVANAAPAVADAEATTSARSILDVFSPYLALCWILGMIFYAMKIAGSWHQLNKLRRSPSESVADVFDTFNAIAQKMKIVRKVKLILTDKVDEPLTFGHIKPVILVPFSYAAQVPLAQFEMILAHELAHIRRNDYIINLLQSVLDTIYFFNPFVYMISKTVRTEREYCCDDLAAHTCGNKETMAIALTNLKLFSHNPSLTLAATPARGTFHKRIFRLLEPGAGHSPKISFAGVIVLCSFVVFLAKCVSDLGEPLALPQPTDMVEQLYADNQAGHKIEIFKYTLKDQPHELFFVSTEAGKPLYAYLDGDTLSTDMLVKAREAIMRSRRITAEQLTATPLTASELRAQRSSFVNGEIMRLESTIKAGQALMLAENNTVMKKEIDSLWNQLSVYNGESVKLAMEGYKDEVKNIPLSVHMHELLTRIITTRQYTKEDREQLHSYLVPEK